MFPLIRFAAGVVTGIVAMQLIKHKSTKETLEKARGQLRGATVSGLEAIESASAKARAKLAAADAPAVFKQVTTGTQTTPYEATESDQEPSS